MNDDINVFSESTLSSPPKYKSLLIAIFGILSIVGISSYIAYSNFDVIKFGSSNKAAPISTFNFNGKNINILKLFGQNDIKETSSGLVNGYGIFHASGVHVDKSSNPNKVYVIDTGNNRILGYNGVGYCKIKTSISCTIDKDCGGNDSCKVDGTKNPDIVIGQTNLSTGTCNGDNNLGVDKKPTQSTLCLTPFGNFTHNTAEYWMRTNIDTDSQGNLYVPDVWNNRILKYNQPFNKPKGQTINADSIFGQNDFNSNGPNKGSYYTESNPMSKSSINISSGADNVSSRGVSVDSDNNIWIADTFNHRVLRYAPNAIEANLVIGEPNFNTSTYDACQTETPPQNIVCYPTLAKINPYTGDLWVIDEYVESGFKARILIFKKDGNDFTSGMNSSSILIPQQPVLFNGMPFKNWSDEKKYIFQATGLTFNPLYKKGGEYDKGIAWINEHESNRTLLIDENGKIVTVIGASDINSRGGDGASYSDKCNIGDLGNNFHLVWPGGSIGIDSDNNIYLADEQFKRIARYALPYKTNILKDGTKCLPDNNGGLFPGTSFNIDASDKYGPLAKLFNNDDLNKKMTGFFGMTVFNSSTSNQLIVNERPGQLRIWNDYFNHNIGDKPDIVLNRPELSNLRTMSGATDDSNRLWMFNTHGQIEVYQLPIMSEFDQPITTPDSTIYWSDNNSLVNLNIRELTGFAFDKTNKRMYLTDSFNNRILRLKNYNDIGKTNLQIDMVLGQPDKNAIKCNHNQDESDLGSPSANSLCALEQIKFDNYGNLYAIENTYECHGNDRISIWMSSDLNNESNNLFPNINARKVLVQKDLTTKANCAEAYLTTGYPHSPVSLAFDSQNHMVVGNDGYYGDRTKRAISQLWYYSNPLIKQTPDSAIPIAMGTPAEIVFDGYDNLFIQDGTWPRVLGVNLESNAIITPTIDKEKNTEESKPTTSTSPTSDNKDTGSVQDTTTPTMVTSTEETKITEAPSEITIEDNSNDSSKNSSDSYRLELTIVDENQKVLSNIQVNSNQFSGNIYSDKSGKVIINNLKQGDLILIFNYNGSKISKTIHIAGNDYNQKQTIQLKSESNNFTLYIIAILAILAISTSIVILYKKGVLKILIEKFKKKK